MGARRRLNPGRKWATLLGFAALLPLAAGFPQAVATQDQTPLPPLKNVQVLTGLTPAQVRETMKSFASGLGVECSFCHVEDDFASDAKDEKLVARRMLVMTNQINADNFDGRKEISCFTCHQGHERPRNRPSTSH